VSDFSGRWMLVNALEKEETRIAVVRDGRLEDLHVERTSHETLVGNLYKGRVENVHASLQAAFVNIGLEKNAFLHVSETVGEGEEPYHHPQRGQRPRGPKRLIQNLLRPGQEVIVQVIRDPFGEKGPSVSMEVSLPGRFLVLTPLTTKVGVSKKITNPQARTQLRTLMRQLTEESPANVGFIVRTASSDTPIQDLKNDFEYLMFEDNKPAGLEAVELKSGGPCVALDTLAVGAHRPDQILRLCVAIVLGERPQHRHCRRIISGLVGPHSILEPIGERED